MHTCENSCPWTWTFVHKCGSNFMRHTLPYLLVNLAKLICPLLSPWSELLSALPSLLPPPTGSDLCFQCWSVYLPLPHLLWVPVSRLLFCLYNQYTADGNSWGPEIGLASSLLCQIVISLRAYYHMVPLVLLLDSLYILSALWTFFQSQAVFQ